jgi:hypothetical protein
MARWPLTAGPPSTVIRRAERSRTPFATPESATYHAEPIYDARAAKWRVTRRGSHPRSPPRAWSTAQALPQAAALRPDPGRAGGRAPVRAWPGLRVRAVVASRLQLPARGGTRRRGLALAHATASFSHAPKAATRVAAGRCSQASDHLRCRPRLAPGCRRPPPRPVRSAVRDLSAVTITLPWGGGSGLRSRSHRKDGRRVARIGVGRRAMRAPRSARTGRCRRCRVVRLPRPERA